MSKTQDMPPHPLAPPKWRQHRALDFLWRLLVVLAADFIGAVSVNNFLVPAHILAGGITGVSQIIHHYFAMLGIGTLYALLNLPLFILGYRYLGKRFVGLTAVAIVGFSIFTDIVHLHFTTVHDPLLIGLYGGILTGISSGIVIRVGGSMGGTDILSLVLFRLTGRSIGGTGFAINAFVVALSGLVFGVEAAMYTLVSIFAASRVVNALMNYQQRKTALIVTTRPTEISKEISARLGRGSTLLNASGTYTNASVGVLMCAMTSLELTELKILSVDLDPQVFITILDTTEVFGRFRPLSL